MPKPNNKSTRKSLVLAASHPIWQGNSVIRSDIVTYNGKHLPSGSQPNRVFYYKTFNTLGSGSFGTVYKGDAYVINFDSKQLKRKRKKKVIKVSYNVNSIKKELIKYEYTQAKKTTHLGMKEPIFTGKEGDETCYIIMNQQPGSELKNLLESARITLLSTHQKLELSYKLLVALRDQVTRSGIIHRDIKPGNIMVQLEPEIKVSIIDYGLAVDKDINNPLPAGTPSFTAPEIFDQAPPSFANDVFSMAKVIALFWINDDSFYRPRPDQCHHVAQISARLIKENQNEALKQHPEMLTLLKQMLNPNPDRRITIEKAIEYFEDTYSNLTIFENKDSSQSSLYDRPDHKLSIDRKPESIQSRPCSLIISDNNDISQSSSYDAPDHRLSIDKKPEPVESRQCRPIISDNNDSSQSSLYDAPDHRLSIDKKLKPVQSRQSGLTVHENIHIYQIQSYLNQLSNYAKQIKNTHPEDYAITKNFVREMNQILNAEDKNIDDIERDCRQKLNEEDIQSCAKNHKRTAFLLKNIALAVAGLGLFYGIAFGINKLITGRNGFFHNEISKAHHHMKDELELLSNPYTRHW